MGERNRHEWRRAGDARWRRKVRREPSSLMVILIGLAMGGAIAAAIIAWPQAETSVAAVVHGDGTRFGACHSGGGINCVVDGDTFWMNGQKIRVADIDAPETHPSRCAYEAQLGNQATARLRDLLNEGPVELVLVDRDTDRYGRLLRVVERNGTSLGDILVSEGLARRWTGSRQPWC